MQYIFSMEATQLLHIHVHLNYLEISKSLSFPFFFRKVWSWFQHHSLGLLFVSCLEYFWVQAVLIIKHIYSIYLRTLEPMTRLSPVWGKWGMQPHTLLPVWSRRHALVAAWLMIVFTTCDRLAELTVLSSRNTAAPHCPPGVPPWVH